mmetsp:Transcript_19367/g.48466  ORF Transcript_19367/g.48466 Transcript_19367/m.48466 type:complete len:363 (-) Transcript_19367:605-1693(-)
MFKLSRSSSWRKAWTSSDVASVESSGSQPGSMYSVWKLDVNDTRGSAGLPDFGGRGALNVARTCSQSAVGSGCSNVAGFACARTSAALRTDTWPSKDELPSSFATSSSACSKTSISSSSNPRIRAFRAADAEEVSPRASGSVSWGENTCVRLLVSPPSLLLDAGGGVVVVGGTVVELVVNKLRGASLLVGKLEITLGRSTEVRSTGTFVDESATAWCSYVSCQSVAPALDVSKTRALSLSPGPLVVAVRRRCISLSAPSSDGSTPRTVRNALAADPSQLLPPSSGPLVSYSSLLLLLLDCCAHVAHGPFPAQLVGHTSATLRYEHAPTPTRQAHASSLEAQPLPPTAAFRYLANASPSTQPP